VVFILLLLILRKFAWGPICDALDHREQSIANNLAEAQRSHDEAKRLLAEHEARLAQTAGQVRALMDEARRDAEAQQQAILAEAEAAAANQKQRALKEIDAAKNAALADLARASVDQALGLAGRIVGQELRADDHDRLIQDALAKFPSKN
jgi:F-type H+-transporting ATPase subunit b